MDKSVMQKAATGKSDEAIWSPEALTDLFNEKYHFYRDVLQFSDKTAREQASKLVDSFSKLIK